jgi:hypothetical protein
MTATANHGDDQEHGTRSQESSRYDEENGGHGEDFPARNEINVIGVIES